MVDKMKLLTQFESGELTITLDEETAKKVREACGFDQRRAEYEFVKNALEKQIPKKPIRHYEIIGRQCILTGCECPNENCNNHSLGNNEYQFDCCECCGQALDWSDEK